MKKFSLLLMATVAIFLFSFKTDEGMFPLSELSKKDLKSAGLRMDAADLFNPGGVSLAHAVVQVDGCTGSFISNEGLVITNHHCVFSTVSNMSTKENNLLDNGFHAADKSKELKTGKTVRIMDSYEDVSPLILDWIKPEMNPREKADMIATRIQAILQKEQFAHQGKYQSEVSEMLPGRSYVLFRYITLLDVRLVYVPPRSIGEFGGESDNWVWPRHNGDFSLVRAYIGKDGKPAKYSPENVPYTPRRFLKVNASGTHEGDFVFILGYPGRTFRHQPARFLQYHQKYNLPFTENWNQWRIDLMEELGKTDKDRQLRFAGPIQGLSNTAKNFRGKMQGLARTGLVDQRLAEDAQMAAGSASAATLLQQVNTVYDKKEKLAPLLFAINAFYRDIPYFNCAATISALKTDYLKLRKKKDTAAMKKFLAMAEASAFSNYRVTDREYEQKVLVHLLEIFRNLPAEHRQSAIDELGDPGTWVNKLYTKTKLTDPKYMKELFVKNPKKFFSYSDAYVKLVKKMLPVVDTVRKQDIALNQQANALMPAYVDLRMEVQKSTFIPDANSTLRFTYGYIRGYSPDDGVYNKPYTTIDGIFQKANTTEDYQLPDHIASLLKQDKVNQMFLNKENGKVAVAFLYNLDTTGGNSGSPILDADGNLIGVNFDRAFTATINDYAWNEAYSRSIGVDIRYVVYVLKYVGGADHLISEMGVNIGS